MSKRSDYLESLKDEDEQRSVIGEHDYTRKDATRHIVQGKANPSKLRMKLLRNLEGVRKNQAIAKSEISSMHSIRSRVSKASTRVSVAPSLAKVDEADQENAKVGCCEVTKQIIEEEDMAINEDISN